MTTACFPQTVTKEAILFVSKTKEIKNWGLTFSTPGAVIASPLPQLRAERPVDPKPQQSNMGSIKAKHSMQCFPILICPCNHIPQLHYRFDVRQRDEDCKTKI